MLSFITKALNRLGLYTEKQLNDACYDANQQGLKQSYRLERYQVELAQFALRQSKARVDELREELAHADHCVGNLAVQRDAAQRRADALQARVDELMLEYCPSEMTPVAFSPAISSR